MSIEKSVEKSSCSRVENWRLRLRVRMGRARLDREIAAGASTGEPAVRALRARQLCSRIERQAIAAALTNILDAAEERQADQSSPLNVQHAAVIAARQGILELVELLRSGAWREPRGVALASLLTRDPTSPIFSSSPDRTVHEALSEIAAALQRRT